MIRRRRQFLCQVSAAASALWVPGVMADQMAATAPMTEGPFYPDQLPLDTDNDLIIVNDSLSPAVGEITYLSGQVFSASGIPVAGAHVEIWQCDSAGIYMHSRDRRHNERDANFQSYGRFITDRKGRYFFRTIKPVQYTGRTPHIHYAVSISGHRVLTTQMLVRGEASNEKDSLFKRVAPERRDTILADFVAAPNQDKKSPPVQWDVRFNLCLGKTADERQLNEAAKG